MLHRARPRRSGDEAEAVNEVEAPAAIDDADEAAAPAKQKRRFPWKKNRAEDEGGSVDEAGSADEAGSTDEDEAAAVAAQDAAATTGESDPAPEAVSDGETVEAPADAAPTEVITGVVVEEAPAAAGPETIEVRPEPATVATPIADVVVPSDDAPDVLPVAPQAPGDEPEVAPVPAEPVSAKPAATRSPTLLPRRSGDRSSMIPQRVPSRVPRAPRLAATSTT